MACPARQIWPDVVSPLIAPFTVHVTRWSVLPSTVANTGCDPAGGTVDVDGITVTCRAGVIVTCALPVAEGSASLTATMETGFVAGTPAGAR